MINGPRSVTERRRQLPRPLKPFARAMAYFPPVRRRWGKGMWCVLPSALLEIVALPFIFRYVLNGVTDGSMDTGGVALWALVIVAVGVAKGAAKFGMRWYITGASREFEQHYRQDLFRHLMRLTPHDLRGVRTGDIMSRSVADLEAVRLLLGPSVMYVAQAAIIVPVALVLMFVIDPTMALLMIVPFVALASIVKIAARPTQHWSQIGQERLADLSTVAQENLSGIRVVKAFAREAVAASAFRRMGQAFMQANVKLATLRGSTQAAISIAKDLGLLIVIVVGGWRLLQGNMQPGDFWWFIEVLNRSMWPLIAIGWMLGMYTRAVSGAKRLDELFEIVPSVDEPADPAPITALRGELRTKNLTFAWEPGGAPVLEDVSLHVAAGTVLGITGRTGCGKSTLVQLLTRQVEPPPGSVLVDGSDIRDIPLDVLRAGMAVVPQDTFLFSETLRDNIAFSRELEDEQLEAMARVAHVHDDIQGFDRAYETMLGERGVTLSGGQRQRTAIARALAANAPVLILDDCLSAVDSVTERRILEGLRGKLKDSTAIIVSHRVAALSLADRIVVLDEGRVVEEGSHAQLVAAGGLYADIQRRQDLEAEIEAL